MTMRVFALVLVLLFATVNTGAAAGECLRQGEFALALAKKLSLDAAAEEEAAVSLTSVDIAPDKGWKPQIYLDAAVFNEIDRALVVAFAEGKLERGYPSAARAVLSSVAMTDSCSATYHGVAPVPAAAPLSATSLDSPSPKASPQQQKTAAVSPAAAQPIPIDNEPRPGVDEPGPGEKPVPISPFEPWDGPTRPGPGSR